MPQTRQPNIYMVPFRCKITGAKRDAPRLAKPRVPLWCQDGMQSLTSISLAKLTWITANAEPERCVKGAKQFIVWHQDEGNNIVFPELAVERGGIWRSPGELRVNLSRRDSDN